MKEFEGKIKFSIRNMPYKYRDFSHLAAEALLAAGDQGKYWEMHDVLIEKSPDLDRKSLLLYAAELGLDLERFRKDLDGMKHSAQIEKDKKLAVDLDLYNTPSFFINGRLVIGNRPYTYMKKIVEEEL